MPAAKKLAAVSAVAFQEGGVWIVQGVEYDICTHAEDPSDLPYAFCKAVVENVCITASLGRQPLEGVPPAPRKYREMFERAVASVQAVKPLPAHPKLPGGVDIRFGRAA